MQSCHDNVTGFGRLQRDLRRLTIADLAEDNDVGSLAQGRPQRLAKIDLVISHLALGNQGGKILRINKLDRVFEGNHMLPPALGAAEDHRGNGRRLAAAGRTADEKKPVFRFEKRLHGGGRHLDLLRFGNHVGQEPQHPPQPPFRHHLADAVAAAMQVDRAVHATRLDHGRQGEVVDHVVVNHFTVGLVGQRLIGREIEVADPGVLTQLFKTLADRGLGVDLEKVHALRVRLKQLPLNSSAKPRCSGTGRVGRREREHNGRAVEFHRLGRHGAI